jgi:hypothetical protein
MLHREAEPMPWFEKKIFPSHEKYHCPCLTNILARENQGRQVADVFIMLRMEGDDS